MVSFESVKRELLALAPRQLSERLRTMHAQKLLEVFLQEAGQDRELRAQLSYWEKWYPEYIRKPIDQMMRNVNESEDGSLPLQLERAYSEKELECVFSNLGAIQLTFGCSKNCPMCGIDAVPGVREQFSFPVLENMFKRFGKFLSIHDQSSRPILYWSSDPSDYEWSNGTETYTYPDVHALAKRYAEYTPHMTTKEYRRQGWVEFLKTHPDKRVSVHGSTKEQAAEIKQSVDCSTLTDEEKNQERSSLVGIGEKQLTGIGISITKDRSFVGKRGIGCFNGLLLTPRGLYNIFQVPISDQYPQGHIVVPLESITDNPVAVGDSLLQIMKEKILCVDFIIDDCDKDKGYAEPILQWAGNHYSLKVGPDFCVMEVKGYDIDPEVIDLGRLDIISVDLVTVERELPVNWTKFEKIETVYLSDLVEAAMTIQPFAQQTK